MYRRAALNIDGKGYSAAEKMLWWWLQIRSGKNKVG
jgi:hypothetical protein